MHYFQLALKKYAVFDGRAQRAEYWYFVLFNAIFSLALSFLSLFSDIINVIYSLYALALFIPSISLSVRRLHDIGKSGWMMLILLIPLVGAIWFLVLMARDSDPGQNQYGPNPKENIPTNTPVNI